MQHSTWDVNYDHDHGPVRTPTAVARALRGAMDMLRMRDDQAVRADDVLALVRRYRAVFAATGGEHTLSGGEVLMQPAFAARVLTGARQMGVHTGGCGSGGRVVVRGPGGGAAVPARRPRN
ncbi:hypothetical protein [Pseudactinotalea sp. Z1748]|uniref:hypothetical protein n=1 Tax=Pseudactinotalea sp. Z1748 TaxID=3413027 RepID=UPI003C7B89C5